MSRLLRPLARLVQALGRNASGEWEALRPVHLGEEDREMVLQFASAVSALRGRVSDRKLRLFAVACCRHTGHLWSDARIRALVDVTERLAEGVPDDPAPEVLGAALREVRATLRRGVGPMVEIYSGALSPQDSAAYAALAAPFAPFENAACALVAAIGAGQRPRAARASLVALLRDILGHSSRPQAVDPSWLRWQDGCVVRIAEGIYEGRRFGDLPLLADALLDAGCDDEDLLAHCRARAEHVRGCWALDLIRSVDR
jgi:hypothetical protein